MPVEIPAGGYVIRVRLVAPKRIGMVRIYGSAQTLVNTPRDVAIGHLRLDQQEPDWIHYLSKDRLPAMKLSGWEHECWLANAVLGVVPFQGLWIRLSNSNSGLLDETVKVQLFEAVNLEVCRSATAISQVDEEDARRRAEELALTEAIRATTSAQVCVRLWLDDVEVTVSCGGSGGSPVIQRLVQGRVASPVRNDLPVLADSFRQMMPSFASVVCQ